jgi:hypothetical protein
MTTTRSTDGNIAFVSLDAVNGAGISVCESIVDPAAPVDVQVHSRIRQDAVAEIVAGMQASDPILAEVLVRSLGFGGWPREGITPIALSLEETPGMVRQLLSIALSEFERGVHSHRNIAYLRAAA